MTAMIRGRRQLYESVRRLILTCIVQDYHLELGYALQIREVRKPQDQDPQKWQELCMRELLSAGEGGTRQRQDPKLVKRLSETFGVTVHTLRFLCGTAPGPRYAWPGPVVEQKKRARRSTTTTSVQETLHGVENSLMTMRKMVGLVQARHGPHHPVLRSPETRGRREGTTPALRWLFCWKCSWNACWSGEVRLLSLLPCTPRQTKEVQDVCHRLPTHVMFECDRHSIVALNTQIHTKKRASVKREGQPVVPHMLLGVLGQLVDDARFVTQCFCCPPPHTYTLRSLARTHGLRKETHH